MTRFTVLVAAPQPRSSVYTAALRAASEVASRAGVGSRPDVVDIAELGAELLSESSAAVGDALDRVSRSDVLLVASPQVHGTYTGLLKVFLDRLPELGLGHTVAVPLAVVEDLRNSRGIEEDLRILLADLGAWVAEPGLILAEEEADAPDSVVRAWADVAAPGLREAVSVAA
ncbi:MULTISPECIES: NADPH-dependent FMN reductase [Nocardiopsis]|jgi:FMN reductase|uniref:FMN reductase n=1 Tax=Nocardiopsis sinuspersici TaxID=501010 RepID=A0A1V3C3L7_9ACTN|nr:MULTISPECIES: NAD(P)H-dependent oxidoreductase [Nocardiopsis]NYH51674.1 FMN reductase [Nocardiopsis sinuspersici]OOC55283.1 flavoprotein [Nocardiopsis sinuspersici]